MAKLIWSVLCSRHILDKESNSVSLLDVLEEATIATPAPLPEPSKANPATLVGFQGTLLSLWERSNPDSPETDHCRLILVGPNKQKLVQPEAEIGLVTHRRNRVALKIDMLPWMGFGRYEWHVQQAAKRTKRGKVQTWRRVATVPWYLKPGEPDSRLAGLMSGAAEEKKPIRSKKKAAKKKKPTTKKARR